MKKLAAIIFSLLMILNATALAKNVTVTGRGMTPFRARIAAINGADIYIDHGSESGLHYGDILIVVRESEPIIVNGKIVAMKQTEVGKIKVVEVNSDYAVCRAESSFMSLHEGDVVKRG